jgi:hypothetical protein
MRINRKWLVTMVVTIVSLLVLGYVEFGQQRDFLASNREGGFAIEIVSLEDNVDTREEWHEVDLLISGNREVWAKNLGVYYDFESSPSAVTTSDSPAAVGYQFFSDEYVNGEYRVPGDYQVPVRVPNSDESLYLRGFAEIEGIYYWTDEYEIRVFDSEQE